MSRLPLLHLLLLVLLFAAASHIASATDHIVGANRGWNPNINYTVWSNNQTFYAGDLISFRYQKTMYNVYEVNQTGYDNCTLDGYDGLKNWTTGKEFIPLDKPGKYYFICPGFCFSGMKISVVVHPLPSPPSSSRGGSDAVHSVKSDGGRRGFGGLAAAMVAAAVGVVAWI